MAAQFYKINYKSDFVLTINSDAGWAVPFCIKFWTGMPSHGYFAGFDGENYVNCRVGETPTQLLVMFDDHHMPIGPLRMQIAYHTTIEEFPDRKFDEVTNPTNVTVDIDGTEYQVMLDFTGETGAEIDFSMPSSGVMSVNGKIGYVTLNAEDVGAQPTIEDLDAIRSGAAEGATAVQPAELQQGLATKQNVIEDLSTIRSGAAAGATAVQPAAMNTALDAKQDTISTVNVTVDNNTGTPSGSASVSGSTLSLSFQNLKGETGATGATGPQGPQGERGLPGESGVTGDVSGFTVIQTIDPSATYGATDIAGAATVQATNEELTELGGGLHKYIGLTASITIPAALPAGYTVLDYIANTSSSGGYIDIGIKPNDSNWKFEGSWMLTGAIETYQAIMASYSTETANSYRIIYNNTSTTGVLINANTKASAPTSSSVNGANVWNTFTLQYGSATINGTAVTLDTTASTAITNNICLFSNTAATKFLVGKMRRFKAWHNGTLTRDMIPCINPQSVYGMYDIVNNVFYGSSNANSFTGGN